MDEESPVNTGINRLVQAVNFPLGLLGRGRAPVEASSSSDDEEEPQQTLEEDKIVDHHGKKNDGGTIYRLRLCPVNSSSNGPEDHGENYKPPSSIHS